MKYKGKDIGRKPTFAQLREYLAYAGINLDAMEIYMYWEHRRWLTRKGTPIKTLEDAVDAVVNNIKREAEKIAKSPKKAKSTSRKKNAPIKKERVLIPLQQESTQDTSWMAYSEQLQDRRWKAFRQFIFTIKGRWCEKCGSLSSLQIHHPKYMDGRKAWEYNCNEVQVLCDKCHKKAHGIIK